MKNQITNEEIENYRIQVRALSNSGNYKKAHGLSLKLMRKYPDVIIFAYFEAVMEAEGSQRLSKAVADR